MKQYGDVMSLIREHQAKKLKSLRETSRYPERYIWFEDKAEIFVMSPRDPVTGMRMALAHAAKAKQ